MKVVYMIHELKRDLIRLRIVYPTYVYDVNSDVTKEEKNQFTGR